VEENEMIINRDVVENFDHCGRIITDEFEERFPDGLNISGLWGKEKERKVVWDMLLDDDFLVEQIGWAISVGILPARMLIDGKELKLGSVALCGVDISEMDLRGIDLFETNLREANLYKSNLHKAKLCSINLSRANLRSTNLNEAFLRGSNLSGASLNGASIREANLSDTDLTGANLCEADLYGADLYDANLSNADLSHANLHKANLCYAVLRDTKLTYTKFGNVIYNKCTVFPKGFDVKWLEGECMAMREAPRMYSLNPLKIVDYVEAKE